MKTSAKLSLYMEMLQSRYTISLWRYDQETEALETDCEEPIFQAILEKSERLKTLTENPERQPFCFGSFLGLMWGGAYGPDGQIYLIGPVLNAEVSVQTIEETLKSMSFDENRIGLMVTALDSIPILPLQMLQDYILMLHYSVTDEKATLNDIRYVRHARLDEASLQKINEDRRETYMAERQLLYHVRVGDLNYQKALKRAAAISFGVRTKAGNPLKQATVSVVTLTSLCTRAAIQGGLSPDTAYTVGDTYIRAMLECETIPQLRELNHRMYDDFVHRVHNARINEALSKSIQACCEYIQLHPEEELLLSDLARRHGYTEYYLSRKFKKEVGSSINTYIDLVRIERAKMLLETTDMPIAEIASSMHYCSSTYFSQTFQKIVGQLPSAYRLAVQAGEIS